MSFLDTSHHCDVKKRSAIVFSPQDSVTGSGGRKRGQWISSRGVDSEKGTGSEKGVDSEKGSGEREAEWRARRGVESEKGSGGREGEWTARRGVGSEKGSGQRDGEGRASIIEASMYVIKT
jgi:hypothetical protein